MSNELTPTERQAAMIADLEARLELASEKLFYTASQNSVMRATLQNLIDTHWEVVRGKVDDITTRVDRYHAAFDVAISVVALPPYLPETKKTK